MATGGQAVFDLLSTESPAALEPKLTVIRAILEVAMKATTNNADFYGAFGVYTDTRDAVVAGAVPDPISDFVDWYWHKNFYGNHDADGGETVIYDRIDLRTARAIRGVGRTLAFVLDVNAAAASGITFTINARLLLAI